MSAYPGLEDQVNTNESSLETSKAALEKFLPVFYQDILELGNKLNKIDKSNALSLANITSEYCVDRGVFQSEGKILTVNGEQETIQGCAILNRSSFLSHIERLHNEGETQLYFRMIDLGKLRGFDLVPNESQERITAADYVLTETSKRLVERAEFINTKVLNGRGIIVPCRYGGDEFVIATAGDLSEQDRKVAYAYITGEIPDDLEPAELKKWLLAHQEGSITDIKSYCWENGVTTKQNLTLKKGLEEFSLPTDPQKWDMFWEHVRRGVLLSEEEISDAEVITKKEKPLKTGDLEAINNHISQVAEYNPKIKMALSYLENIRFSRSFKEGLITEAEVVKVYQSFEQFLENNVYDRLLGYNVENIGSFFDEFTFQPCPFSRVHVLDVKGVKEANDFMGVTYGDLVIQNAWEQIKETLTDPEDGKMHNVRFFRRGGTIFIAETNEGLPKEIADKLANIGQAKFFYKHNEQKLPIEHLTVETDPNIPVDNADKFNVYMENLLTSLSDGFNVGQTVQLVERLGKDLDIDQIKTFEPALIAQQIKEGKISVSDKNFYLLYLLGAKRKAERLGTALAVMDKVKETLAPEYAAQTDNLETMLKDRLG
jgi:GGDEF domain-containing protein